MSGAGLRQPRRRHPAVGLARRLASGTVLTSAARSISRCAGQICVGRRGAARARGSRRGDRPQGSTVDVRAPLHLSRGAATAPTPIALLEAQIKAAGGGTTFVLLQAIIGWCIDDPSLASSDASCPLQVKVRLLQDGTHLDRSADRAGVDAAGRKQYGGTLAQCTVSQACRPIPPPPSQRLRPTSMEASSAS